MNFLLLLEWFAAFCALGGAILASGKWLSPNLPWKLWISANILFICLFFCLDTHRRLYNPSASELVKQYQNKIISNTLKLRLERYT